MLRPHSMTGGRLHSPIWAPYSLYATVDYIYGFPAWDGRVGFTAAQASLNVVETAMYLYYLKVVLSNASEGLFSFRSLTEFVVGDRDKTVSGPGVARAVIVLFSAAVMTLSKTVLYCKLYLVEREESYWLTRNFFIRAERILLGLRQRWTQHCVRPCSFVDYS